jgi:NAD(P)-dependent dehydrogenase (short-subunit alcohol dehydrogenase family)
LNVEPKSYEYRAGLLDGRIILKTGASDGIGKALAICAAGLGARVILHGRNPAKLEAAYDEILSLESAQRPTIVVMDLAVADSDAYVSLAAGIEKEFGRLDGLVHNAGILGKKTSIEQYDASEWQRVLHVNLTAAFALTQVMLPLLRQSEDPSVVFTTSGVGRHGRAFWGAYSVSKFGTEALAQILADEHKHSPLRFNCVNPGATRTAMRLQAYPAEDRDLLRTPQQVLPAYIYLLGPDSAGTTGMSIDAQ